MGCTPAPFTAPAYAYAREYSKIFAELFKPQTTAFSEIWLGDDKAASVEYWKGGEWEERRRKKEGEERVRGREEGKRRGSDGGDEREGGKVGHNRFRLRLEPVSDSSPLHAATTPSDIEKWDVEKIRGHDNGHGVLVKNKVEPLYGDRYLPRKFKISITVPGDNSIDLYTNDIGLVVLTDKEGVLEVGKEGREGRRSRDVLAAAP